MDQFIATAGTFLPMILLFVVMYFLLVLPQKKKEKKNRQMLSAVKEGDDIVTIGGIVAKVKNINEDDFTIETGIEKTKILIKRWAVREVKQQQ